MRRDTSATDTLADGSAESLDEALSRFLGRHAIRFERNMIRPIPIPPSVDATVFEKCDSVTGFDPANGIEHRRLARQLRSAVRVHKKLGYGVGVHFRFRMSRQKT